MHTSCIQYYEACRCPHQHYRNLWDAARSCTRLTGVWWLLISEGCWALAGSACTLSVTCCGCSVVSYNSWTNSLFFLCLLTAIRGGCAGFKTASHKQWCQRRMA